jgi:hypothetical protein
MRVGPSVEAPTACALALDVVVCTAVKLEVATVLVGDLVDNGFDGCYRGVAKIRDVQRVGGSVGCNECRRGRRDCLSLGVAVIGSVLDIVRSDKTQVTRP